MSTYNIPVCNVRVGDSMFVDGYHRQVVDSGSWLYGPRYIDNLSNPDSIMYAATPEWVVSFAFTPDEWNWSEYPTYGLQEHEYDGDKYWPTDMMIEKHYSSRNAMVDVSVSDAHTLHPDTLTPVRWWVSVWDVDRSYGGPEEGGWYYDSGTLVVKVPCKSYEQAIDVQEQMIETWTSDSDYPYYSVNYTGGEYHVNINEREPASHFPINTPYYH